MPQHIETLAIETKGQGFTDITRDVSKRLHAVGARDGLVTLFVRHTSASLTIQENADPDVRSDLQSALERLAPQHGAYEHSIEGPDDMPAHIKTMLTGTNLAIPMSEGEMMLGTWQGLYLVEHRVRPHRREIVIHFAGETDGARPDP